MSEDDKHDTDPSNLSPRSVENVVSFVTDLAERLKGEGYSAGDVAFGLQWMAHTIASNVGQGERLYEQHQSLLIETGELFECAGCHHVVSKDKGSGDDMPEHCDECWAATHRGAA